MVDERERTGPELVRDPMGGLFGALRDLSLRIVDSGIPEEMRSGDPDALRRARMMLGFILVLVFVGLETSVVFHWLLPPEDATRIDVVLAVGMLLELGILSALRRTRSVELGANLMLGASFLVLVSVFTVVGGIKAQLLHWCGIFPMLAALLGTRRSAWAWMATGFATLGFFTLADAAGWRFHSHVDFSQFEGARLWLLRSFDVGSWLVMLLAVALLYEGRRQQQTGQLAAKNAALESEVEQRRRAEERTNYLAYYDELTTLPNRRLFKEQLARAMLLAEREDRMLGVLFLDLDGFKAVNDSRGRAVGDVLLRQVAQRLRRCVRGADSVSRGREDGPEVVSRPGGDEFTILLEGIRGHRDAAVVARRVMGCLEEPIDLDGQEVFISASIGIALYPSPVDDMEELLRNADLAMYHAKQKGKNNFQFFEESMNLDIVRRGSLASDLRRACDREEFELHYQPIVNAETYRIVGVEALVRWRHPSLGLLPPGEFISIAEESGVIVRLGDWVVWRACREYEKWCGLGLAPPRISVNVSGAQFRGGKILGSASEALRGYGVTPSSIEIEITESAVMLDEDEACSCLGQLKALGVSIAVDDFGTGYSSLSYVKRFPVDLLKIDRSFVGGIESDPDAQGIATAIIAMAHHLGLRVVAEGVETEAQERFLREHGCDELQGYRFSPPLPPDEILPVLALRSIIPRVNS